MRLRATQDVFYYPDIMVVCGDDEAGDEALYQHIPYLVVEVTSPSTESTDRREKALVYRGIPSLRAYLVVDQDRRWVERHWRDNSGEWRQGGIVDEGSADTLSRDETLTGDCIRGLE